MRRRPQPPSRDAALALAYAGRHGSAKSGRCSVLSIPRPRQRLGALNAQRATAPQVFASPAPVAQPGHGGPEHPRRPLAPPRLLKLATSSPSFLYTPSSFYSPPTSLSKLPAPPHLRPPLPAAELLGEDGAPVAPSLLSLLQLLPLIRVVINPSLISGCLHPSSLDSRFWG